MEFVGRKMIAGLQKSAENGVALGRLLEPHSLQMTVKDVLGLTNHLPGKVRLVVNPLLQRGRHGSEPEYHRGILKMKFIFRMVQRVVEYNRKFP